MNIVLLGPPGAGKGTQAKQMAKSLSLSHISTGDLLRQNAKEQTALGTQAKNFMERGLLVPDNLVFEMLKVRFAQPDVKKGFILDGYPRNINQAVTLEGLLKENNSDIDMVVYLNTSDDVIVQRLTGRQVCASCGANYHITNMPPKKKGACDICAGQLYQRTDDSLNTVLKRIEVFKSETSSLIDYYQKKNKLRNVPADEDAPIVLNKILSLAKAQDDPHKK